MHVRVALLCVSRSANTQVRLWRYVSRVCDGTVFTLGSCVPVCVCRYDFTVCIHTWHLPCMSVCVRACGHLYIVYVYGCV